MERIRIVLDAKLLHATDRAAHWTKQNRSGLVRDALRVYLRSLETKAMEERDRKGYARHPQTPDESLVREREAAWPME